MEKCSQVEYSEFKDFPSSPTGVEPMTFQNTGWNALTTELWGTHGERGHILGSYEYSTWEHFSIYFHFIQVTISLIIYLHI